MISHWHSVQVHTDIYTVYGPILPRNTYFSGRMAE